MRYHITFRYKDEGTHGNWAEQRCSIIGKDEDDAIARCKEWYGLGKEDCTEYEFVEISVLDAHLKETLTHGF